jgi:hypothetical protein
MESYLEYLPTDILEIIVSKLDYAANESFHDSQVISSLNYFNIFRRRFPYLYKLLHLRRDAEINIWGYKTDIETLYREYLRFIETLYRDHLRFIEKSNQLDRYFISGVMRKNVFDGIYYSYVANQGVTGLKQLATPMIVDVIKRLYSGAVDTLFRYGVAPNELDDFIMLLVAVFKSGLAYMKNIFYGVLHQIDNELYDDSSPRYS